VVSVIRIKLKKVIMAKRRSNWNMERLKDDITATKYLNQSDINIENVKIQGI